MPRPSLLRAAVLACALAAPAAAQNDDTVRPSLDFNAPARVGDFRKLSQDALEGAGGVEIRYQRPQDTDWIDVYVYRGERDPACGGCDSAAVERESDEFASIIPELLRRGYFDSLRVAADTRVTLGTGAAAKRGRHLRLEGGRNGHPVTSHFYLVGAREAVIKVRATYPPGAGMDSVVDRFANALVDGMAPRWMYCAKGGSRQRSIDITANLTAPPDSVAGRVDDAFARLGYAADALPDTAGPTWRGWMVSGWPERDMWAMAKDKPFPGLTLDVTVRPKGTGTDLRVSARGLCAVPGEAGEPGSTPAMVAALEFVAEFSEAAKKAR
jgi:hypothetical protein